MIGLLVFVLGSVLGFIGAHRLFDLGLYLQLGTPGLVFQPHWPAYLVVGSVALGLIFVMRYLAEDYNFLGLGISVSMVAFTALVVVIKLAGGLYHGLIYSSNAGAVLTEGHTGLSWLYLNLVSYLLLFVVSLATILRSGLWWGCSLGLVSFFGILYLLWHRISLTAQVLLPVLLISSILWLIWLAATHRQRSEKPQER